MTFWWGEALKGGVPGEGGGAQTFVLMAAPLPQTAPEAPKRVQDGPRALQDAQDGPKTAPEAAKRPQ